MTKEDKKWKRKFIAFLKENGLYGKWIYNIKDQHPLTNNAWWDYFKDRIYENKSYNGINHAFTWALTKEGHVYWRYFDLKWKRIVGNGIIGQEILQNAMTKEEIDKYYNYARVNGKWMHLMVVKKVIEDCFNKPNMHWNNDKDLKATYENWLMITPLSRAISIINRQNTNLWGIPAWNSAGPIYRADLF